MAKVELIMPKMGESIMEATILRWAKKVGDSIAIDDTILEVATDKVDSEVPSPVSGTLSEILFQENDVVAIGKVIAYIETEAGASIQPTPSVAKREDIPAQSTIPSTTIELSVQPSSASIESTSDRFYSPLVKNIAKSENISQQELNAISGSGQNGRVTKKDILDYVQKKGTEPTVTQKQTQVSTLPTSSAVSSTSAPTVSYSGANVEIIEMDRMRRIIADHMVKSKQTSPHVTSFVEADVTNMVKWRNSVKVDFAKKHGSNITFTPIFVEAVVKAIKDFPLVNVSVEGNNILVKKDINIGMAAALPSGNLIVPVIKNADILNLVGLTKTVNDLADRARKNQLKPEEIQGGTFTLTNVGTFGNIMGTPIINQPQVAILATGTIQKKPAVIETEYGDVIAIRHLMYLSLSYDHRVVDGALGGAFLKRIADYLEGFDPKRDY